MIQVNRKFNSAGVLGAGIENLALVVFLIKNGVAVNVYDRNDEEKIKQKLNDYGCDTKKVKIVSGIDYDKKIEKHDIFFRSPGMLLKEAKNLTYEKGVLSSAMQYFFELCPAVIIGVTGTKGKGTTASAIGEVIREGIFLKGWEGSKVYVMGNIGKAPFEIIDELKENDWVVMEMSSFQLEDMMVSPHIAVVLEISPDHLAPLSADNPNYHKSFDDYLSAKRKIVEYQKKGDVAILLGEEPIKSFSKYTKADIFNFGKAGTDCYEDRGIIYYKHGNKEEKVVDTSKMILKGKHNWQNIEAVITVGKCLGLDNEMIEKVIIQFKGLPHRLQFVDEIDRVKYYDDSYGTGPRATIAAINAFNEPLVLILGGSSKGAKFDGLAEVIGDSSVKTVILIGDEAETIWKALVAKKVEVEIIRDLDKMEDIVKKAREVAVKGDVVLLSPACASFGLFKNASDRGDQFQKYVKR